MKSLRSGGDSAKEPTRPKDDGGRCQSKGQRAGGGLQEVRNQKPKQEEEIRKNKGDKRINCRIEPAIPLALNRKDYCSEPY